MTERLRCANCTGTTAYECDQKFNDRVVLAMHNGIVVAHQTQVSGAEDEHPYIPGSTRAEHAVSMAITWHERWAGELVTELAELDCGLSPAQVSLALYQAEHETRADRPEAVNEFERSTWASLDAFLGPATASGPEQI